MIPYSQKVLTDVGLVSIGDVVTKGVGNKVLTYDPLSRSTFWSTIGFRKRVFGSFRTVDLGFGLVSIDQPVFTGRGVVRASSVVVGDVVFSLYGSGFLGLVNRFLVNAGLSRGIFGSKVLSVGEGPLVNVGFSLGGVDNYFLNSVLVSSFD